MQRELFESNFLLGIRYSNSQVSFTKENIFWQAIYCRIRIQLFCCMLLFWGDWLNLNEVVRLD